MREPEDARRKRELPACDLDTRSAPGGYSGTPELDRRCMGFLVALLRGVLRLLDPQVAQQPVERLLAGLAEARRP
jgi:hypothetical protein